MKSFYPGSTEEQEYFESVLCKDCPIGDERGRDCEFVNHVDFCLDDGHYECKKRTPPPWRHLCVDCRFNHHIAQGICTFNHQVYVINGEYTCFKKKKPAWRVVDG